MSTYLILIIGFFMSTSLLLLVKDAFSDNLVLQYKLAQILDGMTGILEGDFGSTTGSFKNIIDEFSTVVWEFNQKPWLYIFGKGLGAGVQDEFNVFSALAGNAGYPIVCRELDYYVTMHLTINQFLLMSGLTGIILLFGFMKKYWAENDIYSFLIILITFTIFYTSKESMILLMLLVTYKSYDGKNNLKNNQLIKNKMIK